MTSEKISNGVYRSKKAHFNMKKSSNVARIASKYLPKNTKNVK